MENQTNTDIKNAKKIATINGVIVLIMLAGCFDETFAFFAFFIGLIAAFVNFILMIIKIVSKQPYSYITCIISMLLLPIIGFGCCASGLDGMKI